MAAAARNASTCAEWLIEQGATVDGINDDGSSAFHYACAFGSLHCLAVLLKAGCSTSAVDGAGCTGFQLAAGEPWDDLLDVMVALAENRQWGELDVLVVRRGPDPTTQSAPLPPPPGICAQRTPLLGLLPK